MSTGNGFVATDVLGMAQAQNVMQEIYGELNTAMQNLSEQQSTLAANWSGERHVGRQRKNRLMTSDSPPIGTLSMDRLVRAWRDLGATRSRIAKREQMRWPNNSAALSGRYSRGSPSIGSAPRLRMMLRSSTAAASRRSRRVPRITKLAP